MKNSKRIIALLFIMVLSVFIRSSVYADTTGKITISNAISGDTYKIYKLFDLESYNTTTGAYTYKISSSSDWYTFFKTGEGSSYVTIDSQDYVTATSSFTGSTAAELAKKTLAYAGTNSISATASITADSTTVEFTNLELGYYLVDTTLGTLCFLNTTATDVTINEKNTIPTVTNTVKESSAYASNADAKIGDTLEFKATVTAYNGAAGYELYVTLADGLTYDSATGVTVKVGSSTIANTNYTLTTSGKDETFKIVFSSDYLDTITEETSIDITYKATLNTDAFISTIDAPSGNTSTAELMYGEKTEKSSSTSTAAVYTWSAPVFKYHLVDSTKTGLEDAKFVISTSTSTSDAISFIATGTNYRVATSGESGASTEITTTSTGLFTIQGLDQGTYYLIETDAPDGYNKLASAVAFKIESSLSGTISETVKTTSDNETWTAITDNIEIENKSGTILPSTGGIGTKIFICLGSILFITTGVILVSKKRLYNAG